MIGDPSSLGRPHRTRLSVSSRNGLAGCALTVGAVLAALPLEGQEPVRGIRFRDVAKPWGLDFCHRAGASGEFFMVESMGSGVAVLDYDGDGDQDLFFVDGGVTPGYQGVEPASRLYRNEGSHTFRDVTSSTGLVVAGWGTGVTAGDVDGDGDLDLYVSQFGSNQLFRSNADGTFTDVTKGAGIGGDEELWSASAAFADVDRDGDLDLYVTNYVDFSYDNNIPCGLKSKGLRSYCHPDVYRAQPDRFYRNRGDGTFDDLTEEAGFGLAKGKGLGVIFGHIDEDDWVDLYVSNDMTANYLFRNLGDGTFEELGLLTGTAFSDLGRPESGMGVELGDLDGNGFVDIIVTHLDLQTTAVYSNTGAGMFLDQRFHSMLAEPSLYKVGFGVLLADVDQDRDLDLLIANGHIVHNVEMWGTGTTYRQRNQLFSNLGDGRFQEVDDVGFDAVRAGRGQAGGDLDGDGDIDLAVNNLDDEAEVYENITSPIGGFLQIDVAAAGGNAFGIGTRLELITERQHQLREVRTASSYMSQNALSAHFGLGSSASPSTLRVIWPDGRRQILAALPGNRRLHLRQRPPR